MLFVYDEFRSEEYFAGGTAKRVKHPLDENGHVGLRAVKSADEDFLLGVYAASRADEMALVDWDDEQKMAFLRSQFEAQAAQYHARFPDAEYSIILYDDQPVGRFWIGRAPEQIRLLDIAILPEFQNRGVGAVLLKNLVAEAEQNGLPLRHMVFKMNTAAFRFYERFGFTPIDDVGAYIHMERRTSSTAPAAAPPAAAADTTLRD